MGRAGPASSEPDTSGLPEGLPPPDREVPAPAQPPPQAVAEAGEETAPIDPEAMAAVLRGGPEPAAAPPPTPPPVRGSKRTRSADSPAKKPPPASRAPAAAANKRPTKKTVMPQRPVPDFSGLPPAMAQSLARLAGVPWPPEGANGEAGEDQRELEDEGAPTGKNGR
jgi:hypothetical protein